MQPTRAAEPQTLRVLVVSQHFWPETFRINEVVQSLRDAGCDVSVLTGQPNYPDGDIFPGYRAAAWGCDRFDGIRVYRVPLAPRGRGGAARLIINYLSFILSASILGAWLLRRQPVDVLFVYGTSPILQAIPALILGRIKGARVVVWVQDLWPESLEVTGFVRSKKILAMVELVVRAIYRCSDLLLVQSRAFVDSVAALAGPTPVRYFPNPGDRADAQAPAVTATQLTPGFNIMFAGNLGTVQALDTILDAAEQLQDLADLRIVIVGSGSRSHWLAEQVSQRHLTNISLLGRFPANAMTGLMAQASALLVTLARSPILGKTVPSKVQTYLAAGKPIIAALDGEGARVVAESGAGLACPAEDAAALAQACRALYAALPEDRQRMGEAAQRYYQAHYDPEALARRLTDLFRSLASQPTKEDR